MGQGGELMDGQARVHGDDNFVEQLAPERADAAAADDFARHGVGQ